MSSFALGEEFVDFYQLFGVESDASPQEIRARYLSLAKEHHPDAGGTTEHMKLLNRGYETLIVESSRKVYDQLYRLKEEPFDDIDLGDDFDFSRDSADNGGEYDYADMYVDSVFREYHGYTYQKKTIKQKVATYLRKRKTNPNT